MGARLLDGANVQEARTNVIKDLWEWHEVLNFEFYSIPLLLLGVFYHMHNHFHDRHQLHGVIPPCQSRRNLNRKSNLSCRTSVKNNRDLSAHIPQSLLSFGPHLPQRINRAQVVGIREGFGVYSSTHSDPSPDWSQGTRICSTISILGGYSPPPLSSTIDALPPSPLAGHSQGAEESTAELPTFTTTDVESPRRDAQQGSLTGCQVHPRASA